MVGDYNLTDKNYFDFTGSGYRRTLLRKADRLPIEYDYSSISRALWIATEYLYKSATEQYERKKAALEQQTLSDEDKSLPDFSKSPKVKYKASVRKFKMTCSQWKSRQKKFQTYSGIIRIFILPRRESIFIAMMCISQIVKVRKLFSH